MITVPSALRKQFAVCLHEQAIPRRAQAAYHKWLRYYWDFCHKYHFPHEHRESLPHFLKKLQEKRQTQTQQEQAAHAIGLYYELLGTKAPTTSTEHPSGSPQGGNFPQKASSQGKAPSKSTEHSPGPLQPRSGQAAQGEQHPLALLKGGIRGQGRRLSLNRLRRSVLRLTRRKLEVVRPGKRSIPN